VNLDRFIGLPYVDKGRGFSGVDCWGLVWLVFRDAGLELPSYDDRYSFPADRKQLATLIADEMRPDWHQIPAGDERAMDCVLMRDRDQARHIGLVTRPGYLLHVEDGVTSVVAPYRQPPIKHRVVGFFRHRMWNE
jgi:cell wall-associated NlpC family hydrolase